MWPPCRTWSACTEHHKIQYKIGGIAYCGCTAVNPDVLTIKRFNKSYDSVSPSLKPEGGRVGPGVGSETRITMDERMRAHGHESP